MNINNDLKVKLFRLGVFFAAYSALFLLASRLLLFIMPFLIALLLALLMQPLIRFLTNRLKWGKTLASIIVSVLVFAALFSILSMLVYILVAEIVSLTMRISRINFSLIIPYFEEISDLLNNVFKGLGDDFFQYVKENINDIVNVLKNSMGIVSNALNFVIGFFASIPTWITAIIVTIFATFFFSRDIPRFKANTLQYVSRDTADKIGSIWRSALSMLAKCLRSYMLLYFITFAASLIYFYVIRADYPLVLALLSGIADVIPILGPGTVYLPLALFHLVQGNFLMALLFLVGWIAISIVRQVIEPRLVGATINVHPLIMLAILYFGLQAGSFMLMLYLGGLVFLYQIFKKVGVFDRREIPPEKPDESRIIK